MSKTSTKSKYEQLMAWLPTLKSKRTSELATREQPGGKFLKLIIINRKERMAKQVIKILCQLVRTLPSLWTYFR